MSTKSSRSPRTPGLDALPTRDDEGRWLAVIEATQGTRHKFKYQAESDAFVVYNQAKDVRFTPLARRGRAAGERLVRDGQRRFGERGGSGG